MTTREQVTELIEQSGGTVQEIGGPLPDGSGYATASFPLPPTHWLFEDKENVPPMSLRVGVGAERSVLAAQIREAARYAIRASTRNGKETDFDPDALVQNMIVGLLGYWTADGLRSDG